MGDVFEDVKAIENLREWGEGKAAEAEALRLRATEAIQAHARLKDAVRGGFKTLADAALEAAQIIDATPRDVAAAETKRGRGPDRQPRQRRGGAGDAKEAPATEPVAPEYERDVMMLLSLLKEEPLTVAGIDAQLGWPSSRTNAALNAPVFSTWTMQREGDSEPVTVWGTTAQRDAYVNSIPLQIRAKVPDAT